MDGSRLLSKETSHEEKKKDSVFGSSNETMGDCHGSSPSASGTLSPYERLRSRKLTLRKLQTVELNVLKYRSHFFRAEVTNHPLEAEYDVEPTIGHYDSAPFGRSTSSNQPEMKETYPFASRLSSHQPMFEEAGRLGMLEDTVNQILQRRNSVTGGPGTIHPNMHDEGSFQLYILSLEEALFLMQSLGKLRFLITDTAEEQSQQLTCDGWARRFARAHKLGPRPFLRRYAVYAHFSCNGWSVRSGMKYGVDYLMYEHGGPEYHDHAKYAVKVIDKNVTDWTGVFSMCRLAASVSKDLIIATVVFKTKFDKDSIPPLSAIQQSQLHLFRVQPHAVKRR